MTPLLKRTSYSRRCREYVYDVEIFEVPPPASAGRFFAQVVNLVRLERGRTVSVNLELQKEYGTTLAEACSKSNAAVEAWAKDKTRPDNSHTTGGSD